MASESNADTLAEEPPDDVADDARRLRDSDIIAIAQKADCFPRGFISLTDRPAETRTNHFLWILRYRLAYPCSGLASFRGPQGKRKQSCKWAAYETDTAYSQLQQEIDAVYGGTNPQARFGTDLDEFADVYDRHREQC